MAATNKKTLNGRPPCAKNGKALESSPKQGQLDRGRRISKSRNTAVNAIEETIPAAFVFLKSSAKPDPSSEAIRTPISH
jgi:hypothetical protein